MNYFIMLARFSLVAYAAFLLLFAIGEGITGEGLQHILLPMLIVLILVFLRNKFIWSAIAAMLLCIFTVLFFGTYKQVLSFLILSVPLLVGSVLFLLGSRKKFESDF